MNSTSSNLAVTRNGAVAVIDAATDLTDELMTYLSEEDQQYVDKVNGEVSLLNAAEVKLEDRARKLKAKLDKSVEAQQLKAVREKLRALRELRREKGHKVAGVVERAMMQSGVGVEEAIDGIMASPRKALKEGK